MPPAPPRIHVRLVITGRVQGVGFREFTRREADRLGVAGWVANRSDGRVEAVLEGEAHAVEALVQWCHQGPPAAHVRGVEAVPGQPEGLQGFRVLKSGL